MLDFRKPISLKLAAMACVLHLAGCAGIRPAATEAPRVYVLEDPLEKTAQTQPIPLTLLISQPHAAAGFDTPGMAYIRRPFELEYFTRNQWAESPSRMLWPLLVRSLGQKTGYKAVIPSTGMVKGDIRLDLEISLLQQEFTTSPSRMHIRMRAQLVDQDSYHILATQTFEAIENAPSDDPYGGVIAANHALKPLMDQIANFVITYGTDLAKRGK